jgi:hypothetical protein
MTISNGYRVLSCPNCEKKYSYTSYISISYSAKNCWSDGRLMDDLVIQNNDIAKCNCGFIFLLSDAKFGPHIYNPLPRHPSNWELEEIPKFMLNANETSRDFYTKNYDFRAEEERQKEIELRPISIPFLLDSELTQVLDSGIFPKNIMIALRRRYWRYLNDQYRTDYYQYRKNISLVGYPDFILSVEQRENMELLVDLLENEKFPKYLEISEIYRQLGKFKIANEIFVFKYLRNHPNAGDPKEIGEKILVGISHPFIFDSFKTRTFNNF